MRHYLVIFLLFSLAFNLSAQRDISRKADKAFESGRYFEAIDLYKYSYAKAKDKAKKAEIIYMTAECYRKVGDIRHAKTWFNKAIKKHYPNPLAVLYYADALKASAEYEEAKLQYAEYRTLVPDDIRGENGETSCDLSLEWIETPTRYKVINMHYFNSKQSDFSPTYGKSNYKQVLFTSAREGGTGNKESMVTGEYYTDVFKTRVDRKGKWSEPVALGEGVNSEFDEGAATTNWKANTMYFTSFREDEDGNMICKIFESKKEGIEWNTSTPIDLVEDSITVGHPAISADELTLLFVAEMKGGFGNKDIWKVERDSKTAEWQAPVNMGASINTVGDEMFPYLHKDGTLYFSSDGHIGMGGLDLFMASQSMDGTWKVENMKYPMNSSADDFGVCFEEDRERGYLSSNRPESKGSDDIFQFSLPPIEYILAGIVKNQKTEEIIAGADVTLIGSDGTNTGKKTENDGSFNFKLTPNTDYRIIAKRGGFLNSKGKETTKGTTTSKEFRMEMFMSPDDSRIDLPGIMYEFGKWNLLPQSVVSLEELVEILNDNRNITIEIGSHTDSRGGNEANTALSEKRAKSVVEFLITYGIDEERLTSKGYGESMPKELSKSQAKEYDFLNEGDIITESFISKLATSEQREIAHQINRRTDFGLTGRDYVPKIKITR